MENKFSLEISDKDTTEGWWGRALCAQIDLDLMFSDKVAGGTKQAKEVCSRCPVVLDCLLAALEGDEHGVWGGTLRGDRKRMLESDGSIRPGAVEAHIERLNAPINPYRQVQQEAEKLRIARINLEVGTIEWLVNAQEHYAKLVTLNNLARAAGQERVNEDFLERFRELINKKMESASVSVQLGVEEHCLNRFQNSASQLTELPKKERPGAIQMLICELSGYSHPKTKPAIFVTM